MEATSPFEMSYHDKIVVGAGKGAGGAVPTRPSRSSNLNTNFSYPKRDGHLSRHESSDSRSSLTSTGSMPGMTDSSDSEVSFDDDCSYNTSASELWDSFWPDNTIALDERYPAVLRTSQTQDYFAKSFPKHRSQNSEDDTVTISQPGQCLKAVGSKCELSGPPASPARPPSRKAPATYSVYPKPHPIDLRRIHLPPRTSSLNSEPPSPPRRMPTLKTSKSSHNLRSKPSFHITVPPTHPPPPPPSTSSTKSSAPQPTTSTTTTSTTKSVPVSPAFPPPPLPKVLRPSNSAFNLRDMKRRRPTSQARQIQQTTQHNATAPLSPLLPVAAPDPRPRPQLERFVSVFEHDSDAEPDSAGAGFARRIARGLHKKSASEKRGGGGSSGAGAEGGDDKERDGEGGGGGGSSPARKRGGSLGRILGLKSR
ncbi:hypothetical protein F4779DRAFT_306440 [Xylariaceae sp. FL0662B]|nr:hypothetical protein F4779DRAFT_306440 [Xylariaceae sp. FL0662B]